MKLFHYVGVFLLLFNALHAGCGCSHLRSAYASRVAAQVRNRGEHAVRASRSREVVYSSTESDLFGEEPELCLICLSTIRDYIAPLASERDIVRGDVVFQCDTTLHSAHRFHKACLTQWLSQHKVCPVCSGKTRLLECTQSTLTSSKCSLDTSFSAIDLVSKHVNADGTMIDLSHCELTKLDLEFFVKLAENYPNLRSLNLADNNLETIPETIEALTNLVELNLARNDLHELPFTINRLSNLETLDLEQNNLRTLPTEFEHLQNIRVLKLGHNDLTEDTLSAQLVLLLNLHELHLEFNRIKQVPKSLQFLQSLQKLVLYGNEFADLPNTLVDLRNLNQVIFSPTVTISTDFEALLHSHGFMIKRGSVFNRIEQLPYE